MTVYMNWSKILKRNIQNEDGAEIITIRSNVISGTDFSHFLWCRLCTFYMHVYFGFKRRFTWPENGATQPDTQNNADPFSSICTQKTGVTCIITPSPLLPWKRKRQPTPVFLPGKSHGQRSLVSYSPWGHKELDMTEQPSITAFKNQTNEIYKWGPS